MEYLKKLAEKIDALSLRERGIVFGGVIFVIFTIWNQFLMTPIETEQKKLVIELNNKNAERFALVTKFEELIKSNNKDPDAQNIEKLKSLRTKLVDVQANLESSTGNLVSA